MQVVKQGMSQAESHAADANVRATVEQVINDVRTSGDQAVRELSEKFDKWSSSSFRLSPEQIEEVMARLPEQVISDLTFAQAQVCRFAQQQREALRDIEVETLPGVWLGHKNVPVNSVGCYIPGGRYPMVASAHMSVLTAKVAGVKRVIGRTPPINGEIPAATITAMALAGAAEIYLLGGIQAIAAMALGTETIRGVDMLVNNVGITRPVVHHNLDELDDALIDQIFRVNWRGAFAAIRAFKTLLAGGDGGLVINISSVAGQTGIGSNVAYCASKAAMDMMTKSLARALAPQIRVVSVAPGWVEGEYARRVDPAIIEEQRQKTPLRRLAAAQDVADAVLAVATMLQFTTGSIISVDGGRPLN